MEVRRTAPVKLVVPDERREDLHESARQFLYCANRAAEFCWSDRSYTECVTVNTTTRDALYDELRVETNLTANLVQEAIRRGVEAVERMCRTVEKREASESTGVHIVEYALRQAERYVLPEQSLAIDCQRPCCV